MSRTPEDIHRQWRESAAHWGRHSGAIRRMFAPITAALIDVAAITPGQTVLDVAGGTGEPSLAIAEVVGPEGLVFCTDLVGEMVAAARREAHSRELVNVEFCQASAQSLPFGDARFDTTVCRLGAMFFPDPAVGLRQMLRVTKPGAQVALAVWRGPEFNPFFRVVAGVMSRYVDSPPEDPEAPGAFRFAPEGKLKGLLQRAGADNVQERVLEFIVSSDIALEDFWTIRRDMSDTLREKAAQLRPEQLARVANEVREAAEPFFPRGRMSFPAQVLIVTGARR